MEIPLYFCPPDKKYLLFFPITFNTFHANLAVLRQFDAPLTILEVVWKLATHSVGRKISAQCVWSSRRDFSLQGKLKSFLSLLLTWSLPPLLLLSGGTKHHIMN